MAAQLDADPVDTRVVKALGHPTRVRILNTLRDRELASPVELSGELGVPLGTIGYHVRRLETLGFIELAKRTQRRGAVEHHYRARQVLDTAPSTAGTGRTNGGPARAPAGQGGEAVAITHTAQAALARGGFDAVIAHAERRVLTLDAPGREQLVRAMAGWQATVERLAETSAARLADGGESRIHRCTAVLMCFDVPEGPDQED